MQHRIDVKQAYILQCIACKIFYVYFILRKVLKTRFVMVKKLNVVLFTLVPHV